MRWKVLSMVPKMEALKIFICKCEAGIAFALLQVLGFQVFLGLCLEKVLFIELVAFLEV